MTNATRPFILAASVFIAALTPLQSRAEPAPASKTAVEAGAKAKSSMRASRLKDLEAMQKEAVAKINGDQSLSSAQRMYKLADVDDDFAAARKASKAGGARTAL